MIQHCKPQNHDVPGIFWKITVSLLLRGLLALQSTGDVESAVKLMQEAVDLDEKCEFAYETLGTIGRQLALETCFWVDALFSVVFMKFPPTIPHHFNFFEVLQNLFYFQKFNVAT